nr:hypothetical protein BaRGS_014215 [Batillaria attramentaria]
MHLADHTVYDDQRDWALGETYRKQWEVFMVLADHGLTEDQLRRVHRQVAKNADWNIVLRLFERGADLRRVTEDLETANASRLRPPTKKHEEHDETGEKLYNEQMEQYLKIEREYKQRVKNLKNLQEQLAKDAEDYESALEEKNLGAVLFRIKSQTDEIDINQTLNLAFSHKDAWPVLVQLVKYRLDKPQRNALFPEVIRNRMWGVARVLLERGVDLDICVDALQELKKEHQWILVARVMKYPVEDDLRRKVMKEALDNREGSVVAHIISIMEGRVTAEERETMFQQAHAQHVWQAVRRLVEEADSTGIAHRDKALHTAVECYRE